MQLYTKVSQKAEDAEQSFETNPNAALASLLLGYIYESDAVVERKIPRFPVWKLHNLVW